MTDTRIPPRALLLDLGNVLIFHDNARLFRELGAACGRSAAEAEAIIGQSDAGRGINVTDGPPRSVYDRIAPLIGFPGDFTAFSAIWNGIFTPNDAIAPLIEALHGRVALYVLSNTNPLHTDHILPLLPVLRFFDAVFTSHQLGLAKPDVAVYHAALARAGVGPHEAAFFDDAPGHVDGARRAGLRGFIYSSPEQFVADLAALGLPVSPSPAPQGGPCSGRRCWAEHDGRPHTDQTVKRT
jgi:putative hydrolase of the HAD superfamily